MNPWYYFWLVIAIVIVGLVILSICHAKSRTFRDDYWGFWLLWFGVGTLAICISAGVAFNIDKSNKIAQLSYSSGLKIDNINQGSASLDCEGINSYFKLRIPYVKINGIRTLVTYADGEQVIITNDNIYDYFTIPCDFPVR